MWIALTNAAVVVTPPERECKREGRHDLPAEMAHHSISSPGNPARIKGMIRKGGLLPVLLLAGMHQPLVHAVSHVNREARITWHYPHARLVVDCSLPVGTVLSSVILPLPSGVPQGESTLSLGRGPMLDWTMLGTRIPGLSVRAALDRNGASVTRDDGKLTWLRLELVRDGPVRAGWFSVPDQELWWHVTDPVTHTRLWRGRIQWRGRMKIDIGQNDGSETTRERCE